MAANGRLPASELVAIPGNGRLARHAGLCYIAMADRASKDGVSLAIFESSMRRTYREMAAQIEARRWWCSQGKCGNAAVPGTSNHGWGWAVDLMNMTQRAWIDRKGATYGWAKRWSDAAHEWWHLKHRAGVFNPPPPGPRVLKQGVRPGKDVKYLKFMLSRIPMKVQRRGQQRYWRVKWERTPVYGRRVRTSVKRFQSDHGMRADGVVGPRTWKAIKASYEYHRKKK